MKLSARAYTPELDYIDVSLKYTVADDSWYAGVYDEMLNSRSIYKANILQINWCWFC